MNMLQRWFGKKGEVIEDPTELRDRLFACIALNDERAFAALCDANRKTIGESYAAWLKPGPEMFGSDPRRVEWYGRNLVAIGEFFIRRWHDHSLLQQLQRPAEENPLAECSRELKACGEMMAARRFEDALPRLKALRSIAREFVGLEAKQLESLAVGHTGHCLQQTLRPEEALAFFEEATSLCEEAQDEEGVRVQLSNRIETLRWLGRHREAVPWAEQLADLFAKIGHPLAAARYRTRARVMGEGEPLLRVLFLEGDRLYEEDEVPLPPPNSLTSLLERNRLLLARCTLHMEEAGRHIGDGSYDDAVAALTKAARADPYAPDPHYESGSVHLQCGRYDEAIRSFEETERLAPGWFVVRSELWLAHQIAAGRFNRDAHRAMRHVEGLPPEEAAEFAQELAHRFEDLPQAWLALGEALQRLERFEDAEVALSRGLACSEEPEIRTRILVQLGSDKPPYRRAELEEAAALNGHLVAGATARLILRSGMVG